MPSKYEVDDRVVVWDNGIPKAARIDCLRGNNKYDVFYITSKRVETYVDACRLQLVDQLTCV